MHVLDRLRASQARTVSLSARYWFLVARKFVAATAINSGSKQSPFRNVGAHLCATLLLSFGLSESALANIATATATNNASRVVYEMQYSGTWQRKEVLIDTDRNINTGFRDLGGRVGADYLLQGDLLYYYTGSGSDFTWTQLAAPLIVDNGSQLRWRVDRALIGETAFPNSSLLLFRVESGTAPNLVSQEQLVEHTFTSAGRVAAPAVSSDGETVKLTFRYLPSPATLLDESFDGDNSESLPSGWMKRLEVNPATATIGIGALDRFNNALNFRYQKLTPTTSAALGRPAAIKHLPRALSNTESVTLRFKYSPHADTRVDHIVGLYSANAGISTFTLASGVRYLLPNSGVGLQMRRSGSTFSNSAFTIVRFNGSNQPEQLANLASLPFQFNSGGTYQFELVKSPTGSLSATVSNGTTQATITANINVASIPPWDSVAVFDLEGGVLAADTALLRLRFDDLVVTTPPAPVPTGYRAYIDADRNPGTGYSRQGIGADFLLEGNALRAYTGNGSNFSFNTVVRQVTHRNESGSLLWKLDRDDINAASDAARINVLFEAESGGLFDFSPVLSVPLATRHAQRIAIPAYFAPDIGGLWQRVENAAPQVGLVVINPNNGTAPDINLELEAQINAVRAKGIEAIGYVFTKRSGALRPAAEVKADLDRYRSFYALDGYFIDEVSDTCADVPYYQDLVNHIRANDPHARIVLNPGKNVPQCFEPLADILLIHEDQYDLEPGTNYLNWRPDAWIWQFPKQRFWHLVHTTPENLFTPAIDLSRSRHAGWVYVTPDVFTGQPNENPWDSLPSQLAFQRLQTELARHGVEVRSSELAVGQQMRLSMNGEEIELRGGDGAGFQQGFSPGQKYSVSISQQPATQGCLLENASGEISELSQATVTVRCANVGSSTAPNLSYAPAAGTVANPGMIALVGGSGIGDTAAASITVTPFGGSGTGTNATAQLANCVYAAGTVGFSAATGTLSFVGATTTPQTRALSCVRGETVRNALLTCEETRFGAGTQQRVWRVSCPAAIASNGDYVDEFVYDTAAGGLGQIATQTRRTTTGQVLHQESVQYDSLGRPQSSTTSFDNRTWTSNVLYDSLGRVDTVQDSTTESVTNSYTARGFLLQVRENNAGNLPLVTNLEHDERGQVIRERKAAGILVERSFDPASGLIDRIRSGVASAFPLTDATAQVQNLDYDFDKGDNLLAREDRRSPAQGGGQREEFRYDTTNRLIRGELTRINGNTPTTPLTTIALTYDWLGNICSKADLSHPVAQAYTYAGRAGCVGALSIASRSPHQVTQAFGLSMDYDAAGNRIRETHATNPSRNRRMVYDALGQMSQTIQGSLRTSFAYGAAGKRYRRIDLQPGSSTVTRYVGTVEYIERSGQPNEIKRYIGNDLVLTRRGSAPVERRYLFSDHLGSVDTITDENGNVVERLSFDAHGNRRAPNWQALTPAMLSATTTRGFTRHEHIDAQNLIHMNGRVYDPLTGRFLQPDPVVQNTLNAQNWNRYSYVLNNPLSFTDPSGLFWKKLKKLARNLFRSYVGQVIGQVVGNILFPGGGAIIQSIIGGAVGSLLNGGDLKAAAIGALQAGALTSIGNSLARGGITFREAVVLHGAVGGSASALRGGSFMEGFVSGAFGKAASGVDGPMIGRWAASTVAGGVGSKVFGGSFSDGAQTASFGFIFNAMTTEAQERANALLPRMRELRSGLYKAFPNIPTVEQLRDTPLPLRAYLFRTRGPLDFKNYENWRIHFACQKEAADFGNFFFGVATSDHAILAQRVSGLLQLKSNYTAFYRALYNGDAKMLDLQARNITNQYFNPAWTYMNNIGDTELEKLGAAEK